MSHKSPNKPTSYIIQKLQSVIFYFQLSNSESQVAEIVCNLQRYLITCNLLLRVEWKYHGIIFFRYSKFL